MGEEGGWIMITRYNIYNGIGFIHACICRISLSEHPINLEFDSILFSMPIQRYNINH